MKKNIQDGGEDENGKKFFLDFRHFFADFNRK